MRHKHVWFRSYQLNRPSKSHKKVVLRHDRTKYAPSTRLKWLIRSLRKVPRKRRKKNSHSDQDHAILGPISLGQRLVLRRNRRLPVRDLINLHKLYRKAQSSAGELFDIVARDLDPASDRAAVLRYMICHRFQE